MKIKLKLPLAFGAALGMLVLAALFGIFMLGQSLDTFSGPVQEGFAHERAVKDMENAFKTQVQEWKNTLLRGQDPQELQKYWASFQAEERHVSDAAARLERALPEGEARSLVGRFQQAHATMGQSYRKGLDAFSAAGFVAAVGDKSVLGMDRGPAELLEQAGKRIAADSAATAAEASGKGQAAIHLSLAVMLGVALLGLAVGVALSRAIVRPLDQAVDVARAVADGDLTRTIEVRGRDETAELLASLQHMQEQLTRIVLGVRTGAQGVAVASAEIAQGNLDLSSRTEEQASALQQTSASMDELGASTRQNAAGAVQANQLAKNASAVAARGGEAMEQVVATMREISASSSKVGDIIAVIDSIAFQTNILALNAAVEAARAGEQGRGFAVVASEVRALAQRSATAAREIKSLIGSSVERTAHGAQLVGKAGGTMGEIVASIGRVTAIVAEISTANQEQSLGVGQVGDAIVQMDRVTQQNAALVEESFAAADSLKLQAQRLVQEVAIFRLPGGASGLVVA